jgi:hypothetical protein
LWVCSSGVSFRSAQSLSVNSKRSRALDFGRPTNFLGPRVWDTHKPSRKGFGLGSRFGVEGFWVSWLGDFFPWALSMSMNPKPTPVGLFYIFSSIRQNRFYYITPPKTPNPTPQTLIPKPATQNPKPKPQNPNLAH